MAYPGTLNLPVETYNGTLNTITITRVLPVVNGFVQLPNNREKDKSAAPLASFLAAFPTFRIAKMDQSGGARLAGGKHGVQEFVEVTSSAVDCCGTDVDDDVEAAKTGYGTA